MNKKVVVALAYAGALHAGIVDFGSSDSALVILGADVNLNNATLDSGTVFVASGSIIAGDGMSLNGVTLQQTGQPDGWSYRVEGNFTPGDSIVLSDGSSLHVAGTGINEPSVVVLSSSDYPALVTGSGSLDGVSVTCGESELDASYGMHISWDGQFDTDITVSATDGLATLTLDNDLTFAPGKSIIADATSSVPNEIDFSGYSMTYGQVTIGASQRWDEPRLYFSGDVTIDAGVTIQLTSDMGLIDGNNHVLMLADDTVHIMPGTGDPIGIVLRNMHIRNYQGNFLGVPPEFGGAVLWKFENVTCEANDNLLALKNALLVANIEGVTSGDFFEGIPFLCSEKSLGIGAAETQGSLVELELGGDIAITGSFYVAAHTIFEGNGHTFDLSDGAFMAIDFMSVDDNKVVEMRNMTLILNSRSLGGSDFSYDLSNVTIMLVDDVIMNVPINISGPVTFVTNGYTFTAADGSTVSGVTAWVDDLGVGGSVDNFASLDNGRVEYVNAGVASGPTNTFVDVDYDLVENLYLYPNDGSTPSSILTFDAAGTLAFHGHGRSVVFPEANGTGDGPTVTYVAADNMVVLADNVVFDGFIPVRHMEFTGLDATFYFNSYSVIKLGDDTYLNTPLRFGNDPDNAAYGMVLDLQGHSLDISGGAIEFIGGVGSQLTIRNGQLTGVYGTKLSATANANLILENVHVVLEGDMSFDTGTLMFYGTNRISSPYSSTITFSSDGGLSVDYYAHLTLGDNVTYLHNTAALESFTLINESSVLELVGARFQMSDSVDGGLIIDAGTIIVDDRSLFVPGVNGITLAVFGDETVDLRLRPGATLSVQGGGTLDLHFVAS